jgi:hypothetical protein
MALSSQRNKALAAIVIVALGLIIAALLYLNKEKEVASQYPTKTFGGDLNKFEGNSVFITGKYVYGQGETLPPASDITVVEAQLNSKTQIKRIELIRPTRDELAALGGYYRIEDLKRNESFVSLDQFKNDTENFGVLIKVNSNRDIYGKTQFKAVNLEYSLFANPTLE